MTRSFSCGPGCDVDSFRCSSCAGFAAYHIRLLSILDHDHPTRGIRVRRSAGQFTAMKTLPASATQQAPPFLGEGRRRLHVHRLPWCLHHVTRHAAHAEQERKVSTSAGAVSTNSAPHVGTTLDKQNTS